LPIVDRADGTDAEHETDVLAEHETDVLADPERLRQLDLTILD
jgi:hypothetical protein